MAPAARPSLAHAQALAQWRRAEADALEATAKADLFAACRYVASALVQRAKADAARERALYWRQQAEGRA